MNKEKFYNNDREIIRLPNLQDGKHNMYDQYGNSVEAYIKGGKLNGKLKKYKNGKLLSEITYKDNKWDGIARRYRSNGIILFETCYKNSRGSSCKQLHEMLKNPFPQ